MKFRSSNRFGSLLTAAGFAVVLAGCSSTDTDMVQSLTRQGRPLRLPHGSRLMDQRQHHEYQYHPGPGSSDAQS